MTPVRLHLAHSCPGRRSAERVCSAAVPHAGFYVDNKRLERQRTELIAVLKKQAKLVDVLKRQRLHLEAAQLLGFTQAEFKAALPRARQTM